VVQQQIELSRQVGETASFAALADALDRTPATRDRARALRALEELRVAGRLSDPRALLELADRFRSDAAAQSYVIRRLMQSSPPRLLQAVDAARRARRALPDDLELASTCLAAFRAAGAWNEALDAADALARLSPSPAADTAVAEARLGAGQARAAADLLAPLVQAPGLDLADPDNVRRIDLYVRALIASQSVRAALDFLTPLAASSPALRTRVLPTIAASPGADPAAAAAWIEQAAAAADPASIPERVAVASAWLSLALRAPQSKDEFIRRSLAILESLAAAAEPRSEVLDTYAAARWASGDTTGAIETLRSAVTRFPNAPGLVLRLAEAILDSAGSPDEALDLARRAVQQPGMRNSRNLAVLARACEAVADKFRAEGRSAERETVLREAITAYSDMFDADPRNFAAAVSLAVAYEAITDTDSCIRIYERLLASTPALEPRPRAIVQNNLAYVILKSKQSSQTSLAQARALVREALAVTEIASFYDTLGSVEAALKNDSEAIAAFRRACQLDPGMTSAAIELAGLLVSEDRDEARPEDRDEARRLLATVQESASRLSEPQRRRLEELLASLGNQ
jgi:tetratricopeptide (TPR) repeat protein